MTDGDVAVDKDLYDEGIKNDNGGHLSQCYKPAEDSHHEKQRNEKFPFGDARRRHDLPEGDFCPDGLRFPGDKTTVERQDKDQKDSGDEACGKKLGDAGLGDNTVNDDGKAREKQEAEAPRRCQQSEGKLLGIFGFDQGRIEQPADGDDRDARSAGK